MFKISIKRIYKLIGIFIYGCIICITSGFLYNICANEYTLNDLIEKSKEMDGKQIEVSGEAIGEKLSRGKYTWININDKSNAIGIFMKSEDSDKVKNYGNYKHIGDIVNINGTFNRSCKEHGGDLDIHASNVTILKEGYKIEEKINSYKYNLLLSSTIVVIIVGFIYYKNRK